LAEAGASPVAALGATARHIQRLHRAAGMVATGMDAGAALKRLRPPAFWKQQPQMRRQLGVWTEARLAAALTRLAETDLAAKTTGAPQRALCERALHAIAGLARARRDSAGVRPAGRG